MFRPSLLLAALSLLALACPLRAEQPAKETLTGKLRGGIVAIGGETTGWAIDTPAGAVEVDVTRVEADAQKLDGQQVTVIGTWTTRQGPEVGQRKVFVIEAIAAAPPATRAACRPSGIRGIVMSRIGDLMPPIDPSRVKISPVCVAIHVLHDGQHLASILSGHDGRFILPLPPGRYTVEVEGRDGSDDVEVKEGEWTTLNIHIDEGPQ